MFVLEIAQLPVKAAKPNPALTVFKSIKYLEIAQTIIYPKGFNFLSVIAANPSVGAEPHKTSGIFHHRIDILGRESILHGNMLRVSCLQCTEAYQGKYKYQQEAHFSKIALKNKAMERMATEF